VHAHRAASKDAARRARNAAIHEANAPADDLLNGVELFRGASGVRRHMEFFTGMRSTAEHYANAQADPSKTLSRPELASGLLGTVIQALAPRSPG